MGEKGSKLAGAATETAEGLRATLFPLGDIHIKKMFGGYGVFESGTMFALVDSGGHAYFKVDDSNRDRYQAAGASKHGRMPYYRVPEDILADESQLQAWAQASIELSKQK